ncbi:MAG TPA: hypothetical protein VL463_36010 [Kofleriaceae bacterium]|nr:hypothetical protein [Kofleriaceae bacterium]
MKMRTLAAAIAASCLVAGNALAFVAPEYLAERNLETASGSAARLFRPVSASAPNDLAKRRSDELARTFGTAGTTWDVDTGVPLRIWGAGIAVPNGNADPLAAERAARNLLVEHLALLAPGSSPLDWQLYANVERNDIRTVVFTQTWRGLPVLGGRIEFELKRDRLFLIGSEALPNVDAAMPSRWIPDDVARKNAADWAGAAYAARMTAGAVKPAAILPIISQRAGTTFHVVSTVVVDSTDPFAQWNVYVDAATGAPVARHETLAFATGTLLYHVPKSYPQAGYNDRPALFVTSQVNGAASTADKNGLLTWGTTTAATVAPGLAGTFVKVATKTGTTAAASLTLQPNDSVAWDLTADEKQDAQIDAYINANDAKQYAFAHIDANLPWLKAVIPVFVNENATCNAYSNGDDIHFFIAGTSPSGTTHCSNTGRINDVLYHEFGHSLNANSFVGDWQQVDGGFGEGQADVYAQTMIDSSALGLGFFSDNLTKPIRESNPPRKEYIYPKDTGEVHDSGMILSGAMWDLRVALIAKYGHDLGRQKHDDMYYGIIQHAPDMPSAYAEALAVNDDNGNLQDGTPDLCAIKLAFAAHGLAPAGEDVPKFSPPTRDGFTISMANATATAGCQAPAITGGTISWQLRDDPTVKGTVDLAAAGSSWAGSIPEQPTGKVVQYKVDVELENGSGMTYPQNDADPMYELFVGNVVPIKCWDFETEPTDWTHSASMGTDEWQWGAPKGTAANGDPSAAHGGSNVFGIDLGASGDGKYSMDTDQKALAPSVDIPAQYAGSPIRLQYYRWLGVEDGHFDHATIQVDGQQRWMNFDSNQGDYSATQHLDSEWRFQDVDITQDAADGKVQVGFELSSDPGLAFGGWTVDDVCIVAVTANAPASCGNGTIDTGETCDDGNTSDGDGCSASCQTEMGPGGPGDTGCCSSSRSNAAGPALLFLGIALVWRRKKRSDQR